MWPLGSRSRKWGSPPENSNLLTLSLPPCYEIERRCCFTFIFPSPVASSECKLASYCKVCVRRFIQLSWKAESLQAASLSFPSCLFHFPALQMLLCILTIALLSLVGDVLTAATAAHVLCTEGSRTVNLNQPFMNETIYRLASTTVQHPARPSTGWILQPRSPPHLPCRFFASLIVCKHKVNDTIVLQRLWRAVLSEAVCRIA